MTLRDMIVFVLDFKRYVEKSNTYYRKPKEVSKQLNFFHLCRRAFMATMFFGTKIFNLSIGSNHKCQNLIKSKLAFPENIIN